MVHANPKAPSGRYVYSSNYDVEKSRVADVTSALVVECPFPKPPFEIF